MSERFNQLTIQTPEGVRFVHQLASPIIRFIAVAIDTVAILSILSILSISVFFLQLISLDIAAAFNVLLYFAVSVGYFILLEIVWKGQTIGKRIMRLRVIDASGLKLKPNQLVLRNLLRFVDSLPVLYFLGGFVAVFNRRSQRLGDLAAGTIVTIIPELSAPELGNTLGNQYNSFRDHPRLEALLRQRIPHDQSAIALQALSRRSEMEAVSRTRLFASLAETFKKQVKFPDEVTVALSDEQYVRNCVDTFYRNLG